MVDLVKYVRCPGCKQRVPVGTIMYACDEFYRKHPRKRKVNDHA